MARVVTNHRLSVGNERMREVATRAVSLMGALSVSFRSALVVLGLPHRTYARWVSIAAGTATSDLCRVSTMREALKVMDALDAMMRHKHPLNAELRRVVATGVRGRANAEALRALVDAELRASA